MTDQIAVGNSNLTRLRSADDVFHRVPVHVVWEVTLACNLKCIHCGSRAGAARRDELKTSEAIELINDLAGLGTRDITLIGGEAHARPDWLVLIKAIRDAGMSCTLQTGGYGLGRRRIEAAAAAGLSAAGISIDGLEAAHDRQRGVRGSYREALKSLQMFREVGVATTVNSQVNVVSEPDLPAVLDVIADAGAISWQIQLTVAMGNAADNDTILLQPHDLINIMPRLSRLHDDAADRGIRVIPGNNIGYFGPYEHKWRSMTDESTHWQSCVAGQTAIGIEADGTIKGCPSLPTQSYAGGNIRTTPLADIWSDEDTLGVGRPGKVDHLWGYCRTCYYAPNCRAGCSWTTHSLLGRPGNNPYCHYRVLDLASRNLRESIVKVSAAPGVPFDHGIFALRLESLDGRPVTDETVGVRPAEHQVSKLPALVVCDGCLQFTRAEEASCHHCGNLLREGSKRFTGQGTTGLVVDLKRRLQEVDRLMMAGPICDAHAKWQ